MFRGSLPALVTPMKNGEVDFDVIQELVEWHINQGSNGLVPVGTTGESPTLSHQEHDAVVDCVVNAAKGRIPIIAGAGSNNTAETVRLVKHAKKSRLLAVFDFLARVFLLTIPDKWKPFIFVNFMRTKNLRR